MLAKPSTPPPPLALHCRAPPPLPFHGAGRRLRPSRNPGMLPSGVRRPTRRCRGITISCTGVKIKEVVTLSTGDGHGGSLTVKAVVTVQSTAAGVLGSLLGFSKLTDGVKDLLGKSLLLELVSAQLDPKTGLEKETLPAYARRASKEGNLITYEATFEVGEDFGTIGGVFVTNDQSKELFVKDIKLVTSNPNATLPTFTCNSWVASKSDNPEKRLFFINKSYLPAQTPNGLVRLRAKELAILRGNGQGERKSFERIYDYDVYNDLGEPDDDVDKTRPVLGGSKEYPYPRRCRTGRPKSKKDPKSETRSGSFYVPRDEAFSEVKSANFSVKTFRSVLRAVVPSIQSAIIDVHLGFPYFTAIDSLFSEGLNLPKLEGAGLLRGVLPRLVRTVTDGKQEVLLFETPEMIDRDKFSWLRDEEFARQCLAGINPYAIELLETFPIVSKLDPKVYGPADSAITEEILEKEIKGVMTMQEALENKRLFILDYHDLFLPYVHKVRELKDTTLYGSRTIFFLTDEGRLSPLVIELTRPASATKPQWKQVFRPSSDATENWLWKHAKSHVRAHDSCHHELISHWLRTHCCVEPYSIAAHRQLSEIHPIYRLLHPHFRYTMEINALARQALINAGGIIEIAFSPLKYSIEISSVAYDQSWRFDMEALPADLIRRGMAVEDATAEHGLRLTIEDYPFAKDGLLIWSAIEEWVRDYVSHYYPTASEVTGDVELQAWWHDVRTKGHGDKQDEPWWPKLESPEALSQTLTTIIWVASAHHAAVNFGQYHFGGYFPNRPSIARTKMPTEDDDEKSFERFLKRPEASLLRCLPSQIQATVVMAVLDVLSNHSEDEEYLGGAPEAAWAEEPAIKSAFESFSVRLKEIEGLIDARNSDPELRNRFGAGLVPYELMKPFSAPGVTGKGVPNSVSI
ncbi:probable lipoxygenase 8, chloroplastic [Zingiber officinale]|uniref:probable lipoxygenase 8, chloroplastic n=1 Tax=Zingiber officinale TaxID=94328 RepID=UPI001C4D3A9C|nr:probable lipoxygenase 8, chloroplastic [Zingiber officinale]